MLSHQTIADGFPHCFLSALVHTLVNFYFRFYNAEKENQVAYACLTECDAWCKETYSCKHVGLCHIKPPNRYQNQTSQYEIAYCQYFREPPEFHKSGFKRSSQFIKRSQVPPHSPVILTLTIYKLCEKHVDSKASCYHAGFN